MTRPVLPPCPAAVSEVVPTIATGLFRAGATIAAVRFTSLLTSFPQLTAIHCAHGVRMNNFTPSRPLHSSKNPSGGPGGPAIGRAMAPRRSCHDVQRDHSQATSRRSGDAACASRIAYAQVRLTGRVLAVQNRQQPAIRLEPLSARTAIDEPGTHLITIGSNNTIVDLRNCTRPREGVRPMSSRAHATPEHAHQQLTQLNPHRVAAAPSAARTERRQR